jgi:plastocyanin
MTRRHAPSERTGGAAFVRACAAVLWLAAASVAAVEPLVVEIKQYKFIPESVTVKVGTTVKWVNAEKRTTHSVLFRDGEPIESERLLPGESWQRTFTAPGTIRYSCGPHPEMSGTVVVVE